MELEKTTDTTPIDYETKFNTIRLNIKEYYNRYTKILERNNGTASNYLSFYNDLIKNHLHKDLIKIKDWLDYKYRRDEKSLGTYLDEQLTTLEKTLESEEPDNIKQTYLSKALSNIYESLPKLEDKIKLA